METEKRHECANMGKEKDSNYDGNCTARHCLSGTYEISRRWILVRLSVHQNSTAYKRHKILQTFFWHSLTKVKTVLVYTCNQSFNTVYTHIWSWQYHELTPREETVMSKVGRTGQGLQASRRESSHRHHPDRTPTLTSTKSFWHHTLFGNKVVS